MKTSIAVLFLLVTPGFLMGQAISQQYIPDVVKEKMQEMYPEAKGTYWKQPMPGFLDSYFTLNKKKCNATFLVGGAWVSTEFEIDAAEFPDTASSYLSRHADKVLRYYRSESKAKGTEYGADAKTGNGTMSFMFNRDGIFVMKGPKE